MGKVSLHHPDGKLSMRVQACIDRSQYASQPRSDYVSSSVFCDKVWQVPAWPNSPYFVMLPLQNMRGEKMKYPVDTHTHTIASTHAY
ncbi:hypothetical protein, partial [Aeromonas hydrophila]|uniref:hypothetical protein n=1 Tax=Aeromonas hydrophila TaxID=644 RepID=UPI0036DBBEF0